MAPPRSPTPPPPPRPLEPYAPSCSSFSLLRGGVLRPIYRNTRERCQEVLQDFPPCPQCGDRQLPAKSSPILVGIPSLRFPLVWNFMGACVNLIIHFGVKFIFDLAALLVVTGFSSDCWPSGFCFCARKLSAGVN